MTKLSDMTTIVPMEDEHGSLEPDWDTPSQILIANGPYGGSVLEHTGAHSWLMIDEWGTKQLDEMGLDDAPDGLSIFIGKLIHRKSGDETESSFSGCYRALTDDEWNRLQAGEPVLEGTKE